nr:hypothetical protein Iba_chr14cCG1680 [Ipomoea batatas]GME06076.1 hypothetical protein Iba_scaffold3833CG0180 [Ipomoea batatas]
MGRALDQHRWAVWIGNGCGSYPLVLCRKPFIHLNIWKFYTQRLLRTSKHFWISGPTEKGENLPLRMNSFFCAFRYTSERSVPMASGHCQSRIVRGVHSEILPTKILLLLLRRAHIGLILGVILHFSPWEKGYRQPCLCQALL